MKKVVTGAAGFIGSTLVERLLAEGHEVVGIDGFVDNYEAERKRAHLATALGNERFELREGMLEDLDLDPILDGADSVFHLAALPGVRSSWGTSFEAYSSHNVYATQRVLETALARKVDRVVYASSSSVYGDTDELPMGEDAREKPHSPYGVTKLAAEHLARLYHRNYGLHTVSLRYFTVYGPRQRPDMAIQRFLTAARDATEITLFGNGEQTRDFTFVADTVEATVRAAASGRAGGVYNVGGGSTVSVNELIDTIGRVTGCELAVRRTETQRGDVRHTCAANARIRDDLGFVPQIDLEEGLARHWDWLRTSSES